MAYRRFVYVFLLLPDWWLRATPPEICAHFPWRHHCPCASLSAAPFRYVTLPSVDFRVVPCLSVVPMLTTGDILTGTVRRGRAQGGFVALRGLAISCVSRLRCRLPLLWLAAGRISVNSLRSRRRWAHSVVFVVVAAHSRQCSVICCMYSAGNVTSPLRCTWELIRDAHCRAVAWRDGGRRT